LLVVTACAGSRPAGTPAPVAPTRPLAALAAQQVIVTPTHSLREVDALGWTAQIPRSREYLRSFDAAVGAELAARGLQTQWVWPADLARAARANPSYAVDPYALAAAPLRDPAVVSGARIGDPLATQLRTMIALQERARAILLPVEIRFDKDATGQGVAVLRLALIDGRLGEVRWIGDVRSDPSPTFSPALLRTLAAHLSDLITAP
jgi:hypothetical protein